MSSFRQQQTTISDERALIKTLEEKGYKPVSSETKQSVRGHYGEFAKAEIILKKEDLGQGGDIGFSKGKDGKYSIHTDVYVMRNKGFSLEKFTKEITSAYAENKVKMEMQKLGFVMKRKQALDNGKTQIVYGTI